MGCGEGHPARRASFSLPELLIVMAVMGMMMALLLPAVSGFSSIAGRRGAVNLLMGTFEQARVAAIEAGRPVHVVLYRRNHPEPDAVMVVRDPGDASTTDPFERLTKWIPLPKGVLLHDPGPVNILSQPQPADFTAARLSPTPQVAPGESLNVVTFNASGGVDYPSGGAASRQLYLSEGFRGEGGNEAAISDRKKSRGTGFEVISLSRYTGRAQFDITGI
jgi:prepilin-type N-terminal cleavage/methylation domain-containing protein